MILLVTIGSWDDKPSAVLVTGWPLSPCVCPMSKQFLDEIHQVLIGKKLTLDASKPKFQIKSHMQKSQFLGRFMPNFAWQIPFLDAEIHHLSQLRPQGPLAAPRHFSTAAARHKGGRRRCTGGVSVGQTCSAAGTEKPGKGIQSGGWLYFFLDDVVFFARLLWYFEGSMSVLW